MTLAGYIEAILFYKTGPLAKKQLAEILAVSEKELNIALDDLENSLTGRGLQLVRNNDQVTLGTNPEAKDLIDRLTKEELSKDLGKAALETLTIIAYRGEIPRAEIDYIRGVNSSFILRTLLIHGLIERIPNPRDSRSYLYRPTFDLLSHLGITNIKELPEFEAVTTEIKNFISQSPETDDQSPN